MLIAAAHLTPGTSYEDVPSDPPGFGDGGMFGEVRVVNVTWPTRRYPGHTQVTVQDERGAHWYRVFLPGRLIDTTGTDTTI